MTVLSVRTWRPAAPITRRLESADGFGLTTIAAPRDERDSVLRRLRVVLLLAGCVRPTPFMRQIGRCVCDLPIDGQRSLLDLWHERVRELADTLSWRDAGMDVLFDRELPPPGLRLPVRCPVAIRIRRDQGELRGTGGILRDSCAHYGDDDYVLVANAYQLPREPLVETALALAGSAADVTFVAYEGEQPVSAFLARCGALKRLSKSGYIDFKEQALPLIARHGQVQVIRRPTAGGIAIRALHSYISALRVQHGLEAADAASIAMLEPPARGLRIVERGAEVARSAYLHDSIALDGARIEDGATIVRSLVAGGAVVRRNAIVVDRVLPEGAVV